MGAPRPYGWCVKHQFVISHDKYHGKCKIALGGRKQCAEFTFKVPAWVKTLKRGGVRGQDCD